MANVYLQPISCMSAQTPSETFHALADATRRSILVSLLDGPQSPGALAQKFSTSRQAVSKHLQVLSHADLIKAVPQGRHISYHIQAQKILEIAQWAQQFQHLWATRFNQLDAILKNQP